MQILKAIVDTQRTNTTIGYVNTGDVVKLNLQVISNGEIGDNWVNPVIELHGIKSDKKRIRQTDNIQIVDLANHHLEITLHEQFMTCDGLVRLQLVIKDDGGRISSSVFYLRVTKSLEMNVMESHDYIQVFDDFDTYMELVKEFEAKMKEDVTLLEAEIQKASDLSQSISKNEAERQEAFEMNESNREVQFNASQSSQTSTFTINEAERQKGETQRVTNENARQTAERNREVRMAELETKTSELIEKADEQVLKVDEFINANTKHLLEEDARKDYMGNECRSIRETMNSNVDHAVKIAVGEFNYEFNYLDYEGQHITANNSIEGHVKSAILYGSTKYKDVDTDEILETFEEGRNLELVSVKMPVLTTVGKNLFDTSIPFNTDYYGNEGRCSPCYYDNEKKLIITDGISGQNNSQFQFLKFKPNTTYTFSGKIVGHQQRFCIHNESKQIAYNGTGHFSLTITTGDNGRLYVSILKVGTPNGVYGIENLQIEEGSTATEYEPFKSNILTVNEDVTLRSNGDVYDELNLLTGRLTQRIGEDGVVLSQEVVKTVVLSDNVVYSYDEVTHYNCSSESGSLVPTLAVKVPTNVNAVISSQRATIQEQTEQINTLEKENTLLTEQNEKQDVDIALNQDAINFMLFEVMGLSNDDDANKLNPMAIYFANQILKGKLTYTQVIGKYPQFKDNIDSCLLAEGRSDLIVKID